MNKSGGYRWCAAMIAAVLTAGLLLCLAGSAHATSPLLSGNYNLVLRYFFEEITYETLRLDWDGVPPTENQLYLRGAIFWAQGPNKPGPLSTKLQARTVVKVRASSTNTTGTYSLADSTPGLPFLGNPLVILGTDLFSNNTNLSAVTLARQSDCSLAQDIFEPVNNRLTTTSLAQLPGAQDYLHNLAQLGTTPDVFPAGCATTTLGSNAINTAAAVGQTPNNLDLVAQLTGNGVLEVQETNQSTNTTSTVTLASGGNILAFVVTDVNGDGLNDIVASGVTDPATSQPSFAVYLNNNDGTFASPTYMDAPATIGFTVDDVNADGKPDIVFANIQYNNGAVTSTNVTTLLGNGNGTFQAGVNTSTTFAATSVITGDFNGDGKKDLLFGNLILLGKGDGTFTAGPQLPANTQNELLYAAIGDINKDGKLDIVYSGGGDGIVQVLLGNGDGSFTLGKRYASLTPAQPVTITDIDGDGNPDIFVGNSSQGIYVQDLNDNLMPMMQALMGRGDGTFVDSMAYSQGTFTNYGPFYGTQHIATGDFNGDGKPDVLVFNVTTGAPGASPTALALLPGDGAGNLGTPVTSTLNMTPSLIAAADMNGDKVPDAVVAGGTTLAILINQGNGTFAGERDYALPNTAVGLAVGDFNGDGIMDVAVGVSGIGTGGSGPNGTYVLFGQSNGTLASPTQIDSSLDPVGLSVGDFNGDGRPDLVVADEGAWNPGNSSQVNGALHVYLANADGTFTAATAPTTTATNYSALAIGDLNNDGKLDITVAGYGAATSGATPAPNVYTLLGNGDGTFRSPQIIANAGTDGIGITSLALADVNKDGKLDVIAGNPNDFTEVLSGNGDGTLNVHLLALGQKPYSLAAADLNGDGFPELLLGFTGSVGGGNLVVFLNANQWTTAATSSTSLTASPNPASTGQTVTLTASVTSSGSGTPTGTVTFFDGTTNLGTGTLSGQGAATFTSSTLAAGTHSLTAQYGGDSNFAASTSSAVSLVVNAAQPDFAIAANPTSGSVGPGSSATTTLTVTPSGGFTGTVSLACSGLPTGATCSFSPASLSVNGSAATSTLTIATTPQTASNAIPARSPVMPASIGLAGIAVPLAFRRRQYGSPKRRAKAAVWLGLIAVSAALFGCGGGGGGSSTGTPTGGTPAGSYTVTVTATSGSTSHTTNYTLTVS